MNQFIKAFGDSLDVSPRKKLKSTHKIVQFYKSLQDYDADVTAKHDLENIGKDLYAACKKYQSENASI